jgi:hypothetical protein
MIRPLLVLSLTLIAGQLFAADPANMVADKAGYTKNVEPFFRLYCNKCHSGSKPKGDFSTELAKLPNDFLDAAAKGHWKEVVNVLNSHEMPPKKEKQPTAKEVAAVVDWITEQAVKAELAKRDTTIVLRRLNREEYRNSIRDLVGIDFDVSAFPQDPPAGGFDNNGSALTMSPLHLETYLNAARQILDRAIVEGPKPEAIKWRFKPRVAAMDSVRQRLDQKNNAIVNGNDNVQDGEFVMVHHSAWNKNVDARDFQVPIAGNYIVRLSAASRTPDKAEVLKSVETILAARRDGETQKNPNGKKYHDEQFRRDMEHFKNDGRYNYGPARIKFSQQLGPQPRTMAEFDITGTKSNPSIHEFNLRFTTEKAGVTFEYAYNIPSALENFWMQSRNEFARPELYINWFEIEGPIYDSWPPTSHSTILIQSQLARTDAQGYAKEVLTKFMRKAYRRPVTDAEVSSKLNHFRRARLEGMTFNDSIKQALVSVLVSPNFLFISEPVADASNAPRPLNDHELATRMSYFIWSSTPDAELMSLADKGKLKDKAERIKQLDRMLASPKSEAFTKNFAGQWLSLREVGANPPATDLYPQYDRHLEISIVKESEAFFKEILDNNLDLKNFIKSDFVLINERLARFYGIPGVKGDQFRKVSVPKGVQRGGIVTQASILTTTSNGTRTSPVKRGTWILKTLLGIDPGLPVANAGEIAPKVPGIDKATVRKRLEIHRTLEQCARCHNKIDPLGFALENFNAAGEWREQEGFGYKGRIEQNDPKIDASSQMIDGTKIVGVSGLQTAMLKQEDLFFSSLASKLLTYALGRELGLADQPLVKAAVKSTKENGRNMRAMLLYIVSSETFESK